MSDDLRYDVYGKVGVITFDRPQALNALRRSAVASLRERLIELEASSGIRALVLTGEGRAFCAGVDLDEAEADVSAIDRSKVEQSLDTLQDVTRLIMELPFPVIAAMNGLAVGMGSEICIACDIRIASKSAWLWFSEARRSLFQSNGVMYLLPRLIGHSRSIEWMMSARRIASDELHRSGLVAAVYDDENFREVALGYAERIAANSPLSLRLLKETGRASFESSLEEVMALEVEGMKQTLDSPYIREGLRAFAEKRDPEF